MTILSFMFFVTSVMLVFLLSLFTAGGLAGVELALASPNVAQICVNDDVRAQLALDGVPQGGADVSAGLLATLLAGTHLTQTRLAPAIMRLVRLTAAAAV